MTGPSSSIDTDLDDRPPRHGLRLLVDRSFGPFYAGKLLSTIGIWIHNIAAAILVFDLTGSALFVGLVSAAQFGPQLILTPWSGAQADRGDRRKQMVVGRLITASGSGGLVAWILVVGLEGTAGAVAVIAAALVVGIGFALGVPAMHALIPSLVRAEELPAAIAWNASTFTIGRAVGPAFGALIAATMHPSAAFVLSMCTHLAFAVVILTLRIPPTERPAAADGSVRGGLRYLRSEPSIVALLLGVAAIGVAADPVITLTPAIAAAFGAGSQLVGTLASAFGIGAGATFLVLGVARRRFGTERVGPAGLWLLAVGMSLLAVGYAPWLSIAALVIAGAGMTLALTSLTTVVQQRVPEELRGRVMAIWSVAFLGSRPLAATVNGALTDLFSLEVALVTVAAIAVIGALGTRPSKTAISRVRTPRVTEIH